MSNSEVIRTSAPQNESGERKDWVEKPDKSRGKKRGKKVKFGISKNKSVCQTESSISWKLQKTLVYQKF